MKPFRTFLTFLLGLSIITADVDARGDGKREGKGGGGGRAKASAPNRSGGGGGGGGGAKRSPMTGSKIERPESRPAARPASRPDSRPAARPESRPAARPEPRPEQRPQRPAVERPTTRPAPDRNPGGGNRPGGGGGGGGGDNRPGGGGGDNRPGGGGGNNRPGGGGDNRPGGGGGNNRPGGGGENRPGGGGDNRPGGGGGNNRPGGGGGDNRPGGGGGNNRPGGNGGGTANRPGGNGNGGGNRPDNRPNINRPGNNRPSTLPGMVTYPNRPGNNNRPNRGNGSGNNNNINSGNTYVTNVNNNRRNTYLNRPANRPAGNRNWDNNRWGGNRGVWGNNNNNVNIRIDNNFRQNNNYSYRPNYWGARPWWGAGSSHNWHHGHWNYGYNNRYYHSRSYYNDSSFASGFMWGIGAWSLGNMIYDMGYQSYRNPYPAPPIQSSVSTTTINYTQPVSVSAAANPPGDEAAATLAETKSAEATEASRASFKMGDYVAALKSADEAIAYAPGDVTLHEYRALVLFALGRYSDAAGVLNPVLASGPGWGWDTMVGFYDAATTYSEQLRKLEAYVKGRPDAADARFLLGYHYLVCDHMEQAYEQFDKAVALQPADSISRQLRDLTKSSLPDAGEEETEPEAPAPPPIPSEKLVGTWTSDRGQDGKVTFTMEESGDYTWSFINGGDSKLMKGTYGLDDKGLLVLTSEDSQMVSSVTLDGDRKMKFTLVGAPDGDPGLDFTKS